MVHTQNSQDEEWVLNTNATPSAKNPTVGCPHGSDQPTLGRDIVLGSHATPLLPWENTDPSLGDTPAPVSAPSPATTSSSPCLMDYISRPEDGRCNYISPDGAVCNKGAGARHWATTHLLKEVKAMYRHKLTMFQGSIVNSPMVLKVAIEYLHRCKLPKCAKVFPRGDSLKRHVQKCGKLTEYEAERMVLRWKVEGNVRQRWEELIERIHSLEGSGAS